MKKIFVFILLIFAVSAALANPLDSIGIEKKNGKVYILHKVDVKESLYSISRKYGVKVDEIRSANPDMKSDELKVGQVILVPSNYKSSSSTSSGKSHTVEKKETYYSIAKKYSVSVEDLKKANPGMETLKSGDKINIPPGSASAPKIDKEPEDDKANKSQKFKTHKVEAKETLYGISKEYEVDIDEIKKANPELADGLKPGMEIKIPTREKKSQPEPVAEKKDTPKTTNKTTTKVVVKEKEKVKEEPVVVKTPKVVEEPKKEPKQEVKPEVLPKEEEKEKVKEKEKEKTEVSSETVSTKGGFDKIEEKGVGELMDSKTDAPKFQALHRTATAGTIIQVINQSNGQKIFVRVIGKLEGGDSSVIIKLSQRAMERLQAKENRINVNLSYIP